MEQKISYDGCMIKILGSLIIKRRRNKCGFMKTEVDSNSELRFEILDEFRNYGAVLLLLQQPRLMGNVVFRSSLHAKLTWWRTLNADSVISLNEKNNKQRDVGRWCCAAAEDYGSCCLSPFPMKTCLIMLQSFICVATGVTVLILNRKSIEKQQHCQRSFIDLLGEELSLRSDLRNQTFL